MVRCESWQQYAYTPVVAASTRETSSGANEEGNWVGGGEISALTKKSIV